MKLTLKATLTAREALTLLQGIDPNTTLKLETVEAKAKTTEQRALEAAAPHAAARDKLYAIKAWREITGDGLAEAKNAVEKHFAEAWR